jgi:hypothetical protein
MPQQTVKELVDRAMQLQTELTALRTFLSSQGYVQAAMRHAQLGRPSTLTRAEQKEWARLDALMHLTVQYPPHHNM